MSFTNTLFRHDSASYRPSAYFLAVTYATIDKGYTVQRGVASQEQHSRFSRCRILQSLNAATFRGMQGLGRETQHFEIAILAPNGKPHHPLLRRMAEDVNQAPFF